MLTDTKYVWKSESALQGVLERSRLFRYRMARSFA